MAKGSFGDTAINALGYPLGIANLILAARGGNLYNQLIARNQALQDPAQRQAFIGAPGTAGMMLVSGTTPPPPEQLSPEYSLEGVPPGSFFPKLPPISPEETRERRARYQVPLTPQEAVDRASDLLYHARMQRLQQQGFSNMGISPGGNPFITTQLPYAASLPEGFGLGPRGEALRDPLYPLRLSDEVGAGTMTPPPPGGPGVPRGAPSRRSTRGPAQALPEEPYRVETTEPPGVIVDEHGNVYDPTAETPFAPGSGKVDSQGRLILGQETPQHIKDLVQKPSTPPPTTAPPTEFDTSVLDPTQPIPLPDQIFGPGPPTSSTTIPASPLTPTSEVGYPPPQTEGAPLDFGPKQLRGAGPGVPSLSIPSGGLAFPPQTFQGPGEQLPTGKMVGPGRVFNLPSAPVSRKQQIGQTEYKPRFDLDVDLSPKSFATTIMIRDGLDPRNAYHRMLAQKAVADMARGLDIAKKIDEEMATALPEDSVKAIQMIFVANEAILRLQQMHPALINKWVGPFNFTLSKGKYMVPKMGMFAGMSDDEAMYFASFASDLNSLLPVGWSIAGANFTAEEMNILKGLMPTGSGERNADIFRMKATKYQQSLAVIAKTKIEGAKHRLSPWMRQSLQAVIDGRSLFDRARTSPTAP